jgi:hypothetical protein
VTEVTVTIGVGLGPGVVLGGGGGVVGTVEVKVVERVPPCRFGSVFL